MRLLNEWCSSFFEAGTSGVLDPRAHDQYCLTFTVCPQRHTSPSVAVSIISVIAGQLPQRFPLFECVTIIGNAHPGLALPGNDYVCELYLIAIPVRVLTGRISSLCHTSVEVQAYPSKNMTEPTAVPVGLSYAKAKTVAESMFIANCRSPPRVGRSLACASAPEDPSRKWRECSRRLHLASGQTLCSDSDARILNVLKSLRVHCGVDQRPISCLRFP